MTTAIKQFELDFIANITKGTESDAVWLDLSIRAPEIFGVQCFDKGTEEAAGLRDTCLSAYAATQGGMPDAPERKDKSAKANDIRAKRKSISTVTTVYMGRMASYFAKANGIERETKKVTLDKYLAQLVKRITDGQMFGKRKDVISLIEASMSVKPEVKAKTNVIKADFAPQRKAVRKAVAA